jgi:hypothetical protein
MHLADLDAEVSFTLSAGPFPRHHFAQFGAVQPQRVDMERTLDSGKVMSTSLNQALIDLHLKRRVCAVCSHLVPWLNHYTVMHHSSC